MSLEPTVYISVSLRNSRLFLFYQELPMRELPAFLSKSVCSLYHHLVTSDSTNSQHIQDDRY